MNGLLEKDLRLLCQNKQSIVLFLMISGFLGLTQNGTFVMAYLSIMFSILMTSTISYDEMDQGFEFLMTLPITSKSYVKEKYGFCAVGVMFAVLLSGAIYLAAKGIHGEQILIGKELSTMLFFVPVIWCVIAVMIPLQLKFGAEKGRIAILLVYGCAAALAYFALKYIEGGDVSKGLQMLENLKRMKTPVLMIGAFLIGLLVLLISYGISRKVMAKKEY